MWYCLVGTDILDWIMINLDGANSVEQAQVRHHIMRGWCSLAVNAAMYSPSVTCLGSSEKSLSN